MAGLPAIVCRLGGADLARMPDGIDAQRADGLREAPGHLLRARSQPHPAPDGIVELGKQPARPRPEKIVPVHLVGSADFDGRVHVVD